MVAPHDRVTAGWQALKRRACCLQPPSVSNVTEPNSHPSDDNSAPLDPNFEGFAVLKTDGDGQYRFKTIKPGGYPAGPNLIRPPHIHFQVTGRADRLVTQMYFENEKFNDTDPFLNSAPVRSLLITKLLAPAPT